VTLVVHSKELKRTTNTGRLAIASLTNSEMRVRGEGRERLDLSGLLDPAFENVLFYPSENAVELDAEFVIRSGKPLHLVVPDGNWRQAGKVHVRHPELAGIPRVKIGGRNEAEFHLRQEHTESGMSTLEAIAKALAICEGEDAAAPLFRLYQEKLKATLVGRGVRPSASELSR
jgi:DTW domain-containing protein YfiP